MLLTIAPGSPVPPFEQLRVQVIELVRSGALAAGTRLPTVRTLAGELGIAPNTVARAYRKLEADEIIETRGRNGSFVAASGDVTHRAAQGAARAYADRIRELGIDSAKALELVTAALRS
ncbi:MAG: GntR family transcriptional regulator [Lacisediminihabitans sp.]